MLTPFSVLILWLSCVSSQVIEDVPTMQILPFPGVKISNIIADPKVIEVPPGAHGNFTKTTAGSSVCYGTLGCFEPLRKYFTSWLPEDPEELNLAFFVYNPQSSSKKVVVGFNPTRKQIFESGFDPSVPSYVIIHGYLELYNDTFYSSDIKDTIYRYSPHQKQNVIIVDWSGGAHKVSYLQASVNTRIVGAMIANFINKLKEYVNASPSRFRLIGHSLGGHVAGFVGSRFHKERIAIIYGLDPAGPAFYDETEKYRLDPSDAEVVTNIHTDAGTMLMEGLGIQNVLGHFDFYPNGGQNQPGCARTMLIPQLTELGITPALTDLVGCNHQRSWHLFLITKEMTNENCEFVGYPADSYEHFLRGQMDMCLPNGYCPSFGLFSALDLKDYPVMQGRKLYFKTTHQHPFCLHHYVIWIKSPRVVEGTIKVTVEGDKKTSEEILIPTTNYFDRKGVFSYLLTAHRDLGEIRSTTISFEATGIWNLMTGIWESPRVNLTEAFVFYLSSSDPRVLQKRSAKLCPPLGPLHVSGNPGKTYIPCPLDLNDPWLYE